MSDLSQHLSDEDILHVIDNELPAHRMEQFREHLAICPKCRDRKLSFESTLNALSDLYSSELLDSSSSATTSRAQLQAKLADHRKNPPSPHRHIAGLYSYLSIPAALAFVIIAFLFYGGGRIWKAGSAATAWQEEVIVPNRSLTPGVVRPVTLSEICSSGDDDLDPKVSPSTEKTVLKEYGLSSATAPQNYQIDYLVNPQLGGTSDIKNLWPEPYSHGLWNAQAKDELEKHLHQMVCEKTVDLGVAQHEIASDWIAAYKKYMSHERS
jgi:Putative zinc-finger